MHQGCNTSEITLGSLGTQSMTGIFYCNKEFGVIKATSPTASYELSKITP